jgi:phospholipase C
MQRRLLALLAAAAGVLTLSAASVAAHGNGQGDANKLQGIDHIVVIYEENHSFDNLYGGWERVNGRANADAANTTQVDEAGAPYRTTST